MTDSGAVVAEFQYDAFGNTTSETISTNSAGLTSSMFPFRFSIKYFDSETGLTYYGYRYYSPEQGRGINRDPLGEAGGLNRYGFVENSPVKEIDPLGLTNTPGDLLIPFLAHGGASALLESLNLPALPSLTP